MSTFAEAFIRYRVWIAALVLLLTCIGGFGLTRIGFDDDARNTIRSDDEEFRLLEEIFEQFGSDENMCVMLIESNHLFSPGSLHDLQHFVADVEKIPGIEDVVSMADRRLLVYTPYPHPLIPRIGRNNTGDADQHWLLEWFTAGLCIRAKHEARGHSFVSKFLLSDDGRSTLVMARLTGNNLSTTQIATVIGKLRKTIDHWNERGNLHITVTGLPSIRVDIYSVLQDETVKFTILAMCSAVLIALVLFRRIAVVIIVCSAPALAMVWAIGALGLIGEPITIITMQLPALVAIISFTDAIHIAVDLRHSRANGQTPIEATKTALRHLTLPCALTSLTTAVGFGSLYFTDTDIIRRFGLVCAGGAIAAFAAVITIVPLLASTRLGGPILPKSSPTAPALMPNLFDRFSSLILRFRWTCTIGAFLFTAGIMVSVSQLRVDHHLSESLPSAMESSVTLAKVDKEFGGALTAFVLVQWPNDLHWNSAKVQNAIADASRICETHPDIHAPMSIRDIATLVPFGELRFIPTSARQRFVRDDLNRALIIGRVQDVGDRVHVQTAQELSQQFRRLQKKYPGFEFRLSGTSMVGSRNIDRMITDLAKSLGLAVIVIFGVMTLAFRSLRYGLISLIPNSVPLLLTASVLVWIGEPLRFASVIVFSICLGIAVDDTVHFLSRFQAELARTGDTYTAIRRTYRAIGSALLISTLALVAGFAILLTSVLPSGRTFAMLACIAISSALFGDLFILPAMLACFVKRRTNVSQADEPTMAGADIRAD